MSANDPAAVATGIAGNEERWAPRLAQEERLRQLETLLARHPIPEDAIDVEIERAALLAALNRRDDAKLAFIAILRKAPTHFNALNHFGALLTDMGAIDAACRIYAEAILHHPDHPTGHVNLANLLLRANEHEKARQHYEAALRIDPDHATAHQGMGAVLSDLGDRTAARAHFQKGFRGHAIAALPYRGDKAPLQLLQLLSSGGGNIPTALFLDDTRYQTTVVIADHLDPSAALPPHRLIFNAIGDADLCDEALHAACRLLAQSEAPVINDPRAVMKTGRIDNATRLRAIEGVRTARTIAVARKGLASPDGANLLSARGLSFPLLLRSPGYHTGRNFILVQHAADLAGAAARLPGEELLAIEYLDARADDGRARKYRVMLIDGRLYPLHLAISHNWKVHYFTSDMANEPDHRREEANFLENMPAVLGEKALAALAGIRDALDLDYAGVDFGLDRDGNLLLFEANATMVIAKPADGAQWAYRHRAVNQALDAVAAMIASRALQSPV